MLALLIAGLVVLGFVVLGVVADLCRESEIIKEGIGS